METGYRKLFVWQKAHVLVLRVYAITKDFPKEEIYGMTSQLRRAVLSVPTNIVEGYGRQGKKELKQFVNIALGSLAETEYLLDVCLELRYVEKEEHKQLQALRQEVGSLLWRFYRKL